MRDLGQMIEPLTDDERQYIESLIDKVGRRMIRSKRCWANSQRMLMEDDENRLCYWECSLPIPHAWVTINGKIVDVTYEAGSRKIKRIYGTTVTPHDYSNGVSVDRERVMDNMLATGMYCAVLTEDGHDEFQD